MAARQARGVAAVALGLVLAGAWPSSAGAADTVAFRIDDARITESSGLARDTAGGLYWTTNDSGAAGTVYGLKPDGRVKGSLNFNARPRDVEALAMHDHRLFVADIGDNLANRSLVTVYTFDDPRADGSSVLYHSIDLRYPDGAHDAETLLVNGQGRLFIVTKGLRGGIYAAPAAPSRAGVNTLTKVGSAPAIVTDGTYLPGGDQIALLTYTSIVVLDAKSYHRVATVKIPRQKQAEALTLSLDGKTLLVGGEGARSAVYAVPIPAEAAPSADPKPSPSAKPTPTKKPTPTTSGQPPATPSEGAVDDPPDDSGTAQNRTGTYLAVGLAAVVAIVAGVVVGVVRRP